MMGRVFLSHLAQSAVPNSRVPASSARDLYSARFWGAMPTALRAHGTQSQTMVRGAEGIAMCGIVGYVGRREAGPLLLEGLKRLEYRGYDSAGLATVAGRKLHVRKRAGRVANLGALLTQRPAPGELGVAHTRWATHGPASDANAHPHVAGSADSTVVVVHNGVIENYDPLKRELQAQGVAFT